MPTRPCLALLVLSVISFGVAFAAGETGRIEVRVESIGKDRRAELLPGAAVTVTTTAGPLTAVTDARGAALFATVPAGGPCTVKATMSGHGDAAREVRVRAGGTTRVSLQLLEQLTEQVQVAAKDRVVTLDNEAQGKTAIGAEAFADLPVFGRDYQAILTLAPGVQDTDGDGNPNVHGSREQDLKVVVDGVSNVDPLTGEFLSNINPDAIEEIEVLDSGADASHGGAVGGYARVVTKSGSDRFEGAVNLYYRDGGLDSGGGEKYTRLQPSLVFTGPIVKERLWFAIYHEMIDEKTPLFAWQGATYSEKARSYRHMDKLTWQVDPRNRLRVQRSSDPFEIEPLGLDTTSLLETGFRTSNGGPTTSLDWTLGWSPTFFADARLAFSDISVTVDPVRPDAGNDCINPDERYSFLAGDLCTNFTRGGLREGPYNNVERQDRQRWTYALDTEKYIENWLSGTHRIKAGVSLEKATFRRDLTASPVLRLKYLGGRRVSNEEGGSFFSAPYVIEATSYYFPQQGAAPNLFDPDRPLLMRPQQGFNTSLGNYFAAYVTDTFQPVPNLSITVGMRFSREELSSDGYAPLDPATERAAYDAKARACADSCDAVCSPFGGSRLRCSLCLRTCANSLGGEFTLHPLDDPALVDVGGGVLQCNVAVNPGICSRAEIWSQLAEPRVRNIENFSIDNNALAPRFAVSWDPWADGRTRVFGSWGRYYGDTFLLPLLQENGPDSVDSSFSLDPDLVPTDTSGAPAPLNTSGIGSGFSVHMVDRNLKLQHSDEWTLGVEREILPETSLGVRYVRRRYRDQFQDRDINRVPITDDDMRNRRVDIYYTGAGSVSDCPKVDGYWDCSGVIVFRPPGSRLDPVFVRWADGLPDLKVLNPNFSGVYLIGNSNRSEYKAAILELKRRWRNDWEGTLSYTWSTSRGQAEDFLAQVGNDPTNVDDAEGPLSTDQPHVVKAMGRAYIPKWGGIRVGGLVSWQSGLPYSIYEERLVLDFPSDLLAGATWFYNQRAAEAGLPWNLTSPSAEYSLQRTVFLSGRRNDQRNPSYWNVDVNVQKELRVRKVLGTVELGVFNLLNDEKDVILGAKREFAGTDPEGNLVYRDLPPITRPRLPRRLQLALKVAF